MVTQVFKQFFLAMTSLLFPMRCRTWRYRIMREAWFAWKFYVLALKCTDNGDERKAMGHFKQQNETKILAQC